MCGAKGERQQSSVSTPSRLTLQLFAGGGVGDERVGELHEARDGGVELALVADVLRDAVESAVYDALHVALFLERDVLHRYALRRGGFELVEAALDETPDAAEESVRAFDAALGPVEVLLRRRGEEDEEARRVGSVFLDYFIGVYDVAERLRHLGPVLDDHALRQQPLEGLAHILRQQAEVGKHLREETGVDEVQAGVLDAADVLVDGHPVGRGLRVEGLVLAPRRRVAVEVPRRAEECVYRVRLAARGASAEGQVVSYQSGRSASGLPPFAGISMSSGSLTGSWSSGTGTMPQWSQ